MLSLKEGRLTGDILTDLSKLLSKPAIDLAMRIPQARLDILGRRKVEITKDDVLRGNAVSV